MGLISSIAQYLYPVRKHLIKLVSAGKVRPGQKEKHTLKGTIHDFSITGIDGNEIDFSRFKGKKILLVNTASECGYTPQYASLQKLHETFNSDLTVIGFPSNNFGAQEPGTEEEILHFCKYNYDVTFPLSKKIDVTGPNQHGIFRWLTTKELNGWNDRDPNWNFCKYLLDENGKLINFFSHKMDPMDEKIVSKIRPASNESASTPDRN